ncbi:MAG: DUF2062 domain-containing protein [Pseudomonadota bacterium]
MIFKRRDKLPLHLRLREMLVPRKGVHRGVSYLSKRIKRLPDSPHRIALGFACGALASFTPLFGFHFFVAFFFAWLVRGNFLAAAFGTAVGNPLSFPLIAYASLATGWYITGIEVDKPDRLSFGWLTDNMDVIFIPYAVGGILPGLLSAVLCYAVLGPLVAAYQERRRKRLAERAQRLQAELAREQEAYAMHDGREGDGA